MVFAVVVAAAAGDFFFSSALAQRRVFHPTGMTSVASQWLFLLLGQIIPKNSRL